MRLDTQAETLDICALRFDGWAFVEGRHDDEILATLSDRFVATLRMSADAEENHAAFFAPQRLLSKWGGEMLPGSSRPYRAFLLLYLQLYRDDIEPDLRHPEYWQRWQDLKVDSAEDCAAEVRKHLLSGRSKEDS